MSTFKVVSGIIEGAVAELGGIDHEMERAALEPIGAEIVVVDSADEDAVIAAAKDADAVIARNLQLSPRVVAALDAVRSSPRLRSVMTHVALEAATAAGIVVTNVPDTFVEEVADHTMVLLLACWRRVIEQDRIVREGRWPEGRLELSKHARLRGQTLGLIAFGNIARLVARRAKAFGMQLIAYDPYVHEHRMLDLDVEPVSNLQTLLARSDIVSMHAPLSAATRGDALRAAVSRDEAERDLYQHRPRPDRRRTGPDRRPAGRHHCLRRPGRVRTRAAGQRQPAGQDGQRDFVGARSFGLVAEMREACARAGREVAAVLQRRQPLSPVNPQVFARSERLG